MQGAGSSCGARRVAHGGPGDGAPGCRQAARRQGALQASPAGPAPGVPASPGGAVLRAWGPATPGRCGQCTEPRRVSPFCSHSPSTPRRPRPSSHAAHRPRRPSRSLRAEFRVCGTAGLPLTHPESPQQTPPRRPHFGKRFRQNESRLAPKGGNAVRAPPRTHTPLCPAAGSRSSRPGVHPRGARPQPARSRLARPHKPAPRACPPRALPSRHARPPKPASGACAQPARSRHAPHRLPGARGRPRAPVLLLPTMTARAPPSASPLRP